MPTKDKNNTNRRKGKDKKRILSRNTVRTLVGV